MSEGFQPILQRLVERVPGALGAIFADWDGEPVGTFAPDIAPLDIQIIGAQWGLVWTQVQKALARARLGAPLELYVDGVNGAVMVREVGEGYYVVLTTKRDCHLATAKRELDRGVGELKAEM